MNRIIYLCVYIFCFSFIFNTYANDYTNISDEIDTNRYINDLKLIVKPGVSADILTLKCKNKGQFIRYAYVDYDKQQITVERKTSPFVCNTPITKEETLHCTGAVEDDAKFTISTTFMQVANDTFYLDTFVWFHPELPDGIEGFEPITIREVCVADK